MSRDLVLAPCGLVIERIEAATSGRVILARPTAKTADCPICGSPSARTVHDWLVDLLPVAPALVLDVGAGTGRDAACLPFLAKRSPMSFDVLRVAFFQRRLGQGEVTTPRSARTLGWRKRNGNT